MTCNPTPWGYVFIFYCISFQSSGYGTCVLDENKLSRMLLMTVFIGKNYMYLL